MRLALSQGRAKFWDGFQLILQSAYLRHLCGYLLLSSVVSSFLYFEKTLVRCCP